MSFNQKLGAFGTLIGLIAIFALGSNSRIAISDVSEERADSPQTAEDKGANQPLTKQAIVKRLEEKLPGIEISDLNQSPVDGFYQVFFSGQLLYVSENGQYIFTGNLLELADGAPVNHSQIALGQQESKKAPMRAAKIADLNESDMVVYKAPDEQHVITVFTDIDCGYCRKLHREMPNLNKNGVTVRYLAFPRAGIGSDAYNKLVSVWCSDDRLAAMDEAKLKRKFGKDSCKNPIADQYKLTREFNLSGTPSLILSDGELIGGFIPVEDLVAHLNQKGNRQSTAPGK